MPYGLRDAAGYTRGDPCNHTLHVSNIRQLIRLLPHVFSIENGNKILPQITAECKIFLSFEQMEKEKGPDPIT